jgi:putative MATE family efflux protein
MPQLISYKNIFKLAFPVTLSQSTIIFSGLIDLAFVSRYGTRAIAAVSIANVIIATLYNFLEGIRAGTTVLVSRATELKEDEKITAILNIGLASSLVIGIPVAILGKYIGYFAYCGFSDNLIRLLGTDYLKIWLFAVPFTLVLNVIFGVFRGFSDTVTPLKVSIIICVLNAVFDYIFVCGKLGIPSMGTKGSAYATLLSNIAGLIFMVALLMKKRPIAKYFYIKKLSADYSKRCLRLMMEIGIYTGFMNLAMAIFVYMMGLFGSQELAIHQITFQIFLISYLLTMGFLVSASIVVPKLMAQKQESLMIKNVSRICKVSLFAICIMSFSLYIFAPEIAAFFSHGNKVVIVNVTKTIRIVSFAQLFTSVYMTLRGALTGCGDTRFIAYEGGISGYLIFLPLAYVLAVKLNYKVYGGYIAFLIWCITDCTAFALRFYFQRGWQDNHRKAEMEE